MSDTSQSADNLRIKHGIDDVEPAVAVLSRALINKDNKVVVDLSACSTAQEVAAVFAALSGATPPTAITALAPVVLAVPAGTPALGDSAKFYITASGADRNFKVDAAIKIPSDSSFDNAVGKTMTSGKTYVVKLEYNGTAWMLVSLVGGY